MADWRFVFNFNCFLVSIKWVSIPVFSSVWFTVSIGWVSVPGPKTRTGTKHCIHDHWLSQLWRHDQYITRLVRSYCDGKISAVVNSCLEGDTRLAELAWTTPPTSSYTGNLTIVSSCFFFLFALNMTYLKLYSFFCSNS